MRRREGTVLVLVILALLIVGLLGMALMDRSLSSSTRASWGRDHLNLRLAADSAAEELFAQAVREANDPATKLYKQLRQLMPFDGSDPKLPMGVSGMDCPLVKTDLKKVAVQMGTAIELAYEVSIPKAGWVSDDDLESKGILRIAVAATAGKRFSSLTERVTVDRAFRVARETLMHPLQLDALIVRRKPQDQPDDGADPAGGASTEETSEPEPADAAEKPEAQQPFSWFELHEPGARPLSAIMGDDGAKLEASPAKWDEEIADAVAMYFPSELKHRAQFETRHPRQLRWFIKSRLRRGQPVRGVFFTRSKKPLLLKLDRFVGQATIASRGPIILGDITLADPKRDSLTIASGRRIIVIGSDVQANLVSFGGKRRGVRFEKKAKITGSVVSQRIPKSKQLSPEELAACEIAAPENVDLKGNRDAAPPPGQVPVEELENYSAIFAPHALRVNHGVE